MSLNKLKRFLLNKTNSFLEIFYLKKSKLILEEKVLILPPDEFGSIGDEAMIISVIQNVFVDYKFKSDVMSFKVKSWERRLINIEGFNKEIVLNSKFGNPFNLFKILDLAKSYKYFVIIGADILDGHYSSVQSVKRILIGRILSQLGVKVIITGSSFNNSIDTMVLKELKKVYNKPIDNFNLNVRDIKSFTRLKEKQFNPVLTMDVAFLLKPVIPEGYTNFISFLNKGEYISININPIHYNKFKDDLITCFIKYIEYILYSTNFNIVLIPHDIRESTFGKYSDYELLGELYNSLKDKSRVFLFDNKEFINAAALKYVAYNSIMIITGRMHYSIAALSNGVPVLVMPYQGKFEGMLLEIYDEIDNYMLSESNLNFQEIISKTNNILNNIENEKGLIDSNKINGKARINFELFNN